MPKSTLKACQERLPKVEFISAQTFYWSPKKRAIYMNSEVLDTEHGQWALLHETAHALLDHKNYRSDAELLALEVAAWEKARHFGAEVGVRIDPDHIEDCLNTYRDWLYARSTCPTCMLNSLQIDETTYECLNCSTKWSVSHSRFCRPYRMHGQHKKTPSETSQTVFQQKTAN